MLLLAFDTATPAISVAVHDGTTIVGSARAEGAMAHGELLSPTIRKALALAGAAVTDLTDVAVGVGPGPFTGLRVGVVTALTLARARGLRAHGVCSLDPIGRAAKGAEAEFIVATDARRKEVYWARFGADGVRIDGPYVDKPAVVESLGLPVVGSGAELYGLDSGSVTAPAHPDAEVLAQIIVDGSAPNLPLEPLYLRRPDAQPMTQPAPTA